MPGGQRGSGVNRSAMHDENALSSSFTIHWPNTEPFNPNEAAFPQSEEKSAYVRAQYKCFLHALPGRAQIITEINIVIRDRAHSLRATPQAISSVRLLMAIEYKTLAAPAYYQTDVLSG